MSMGHVVVFSLIFYGFACVCMVIFAAVIKNPKLVDACFWASLAYGIFVFGMLVGAQL